jgi:hypothetical protein
MPQETKQQADARVLTEAKVDDNNVSKINVRHTDSTHPLDCSCTPCKQLRYSLDSNQESIEKDERDLYNNHKPTEP